MSVPVKQYVEFKLGDAYNEEAPYPRGTVVIAENGDIYRLTGFMGSHNEQFDVYVMNRPNWMKHTADGETITNIHYRNEVPEGTVIFIGQDNAPESIAEAVAFHQKHNS